MFKAKSQVAKVGLSQFGKNTNMIKKRKPIRKVSKRRAAESKIRNKQWPEFLENHPHCEIGSKFCTRWTQCRHHLKGRVGSLFLDEKYQIASCNVCNLYLETAEGKKWGYENGFRLDRIGHE